MNKRVDDGGQQQRLLPRQGENSLRRHRGPANEANRHNLIYDLMPVCCGAVMLSHHFLIGDAASAPSPPTAGQQDTLTHTHTRTAEAQTRESAAGLTFNKPRPRRTSSDNWLFFLHFSTLTIEYLLAYTTKIPSKSSLWFLKEV